MADRIEMNVAGMTCDHCEETVVAALERAGLRDAEAEFRRGRASGVPGPAYSAERAAAEVEDAGYRLAGVVEPEDAPVNETRDGDYDLVVIGAGSAAFAAAIKARELGATVALVERGTLGGTCVNVGCVPSKALLRPAELYWTAAHHPFGGIRTAPVEVDLAALVAGKDELVAALRREKYADLVDHYGFEVLHGEARFTGPDSVQVDGRSLTAGRYLVATGASPWVPPIPGLDGTGYLTSTEALDLTELPGELIVVGANAIGLELGQLFLQLGTRVTFVEALERIAPFEEPEISELLHAHLEDQGARIVTGAAAAAAGRNGDRVWLDVAGTRLEADRLLMATGRRANTAALDLGAAGVATDEQGHVVVDDGLATTNTRVWAAGDVTTHPQFVYVAALGGNIAAENALRAAGRTIDFRTMPRVTFTSPAIAAVGLTEHQARAAGRPVITSTLPLDAVPRALVNRDTVGVVKLVADESSGKLLGAHLLADGAGDVIQAAVMALKYHATIDEIAETFHPYLTMAEALKLAAQGFGKDVKTLSCCAA